MRAGSADDVDGALDVSVVLPIYNERGHLRTEIDRIRAALTASPYSFEIIVVDDGSNDGSEVDLPTIEGIRLLRHPHNRGSGAARRTGTTAARGRVVVWTDVDMTYPNDEIPQLVKELDGFDHVVGARRTEEGTLRFARVPAKWFIRKLASYLTDTDIKDLNSGLRAFRRDVAMQYVHHLPAGFSCVTTLTMSFLSNGYSVKYVPIDYFPRAGHVEVPLVEGHQALPAAGRAHDAVVQPAEGLHAGRHRAARGRARQARHRLEPARLPPGGQHPPHLPRGPPGDHRRAVGRSHRAGDETGGTGTTFMTTQLDPPSATATPTGNTYDKYGSTNPIEQRMMRGFMRALDDMLAGLAPRRILEIGVGEGHVMSRVRERFPGVPLVGVDLPDEALSDEWKEQGLPCMFGDATTLPFPDDSFDLVLAIEVLEHVPGPEAALAELARVCSGHVRRLGAVRADLAGRQPRCAAATSATSATRPATSTTGPAGASTRSSRPSSTSSRPAAPSPGR